MLRGARPARKPRANMVAIEWLPTGNPAPPSCALPTLYHQVPQRIGTHADAVVCDHTIPILVDGQRRQTNVGAKNVGIRHGIPSTPSRFANRSIDLSLMFISRRSFPIYRAWTAPLYTRIPRPSTQPPVASPQMFSSICVAKLALKRDDFLLRPTMLDSKLAQSFWLQTN